jgi:ABC-type glycerol-3-phosphate transport system substrate-binding protein
MKTNLMKITALSIAATLLYSAVSCAEKSESSVAEPITVSQTMYKEEHLKMPDNFSYCLDMRYIESTERNELVCTTTDNTIELSVLGEDFQIEKTVTLTEKDEMQNSPAYICEDGSVILLFVSVQYDKDEITDFEDYYSNAKTSFEVRKYTPDGELSETIPVEGLDKYYSLETSHPEQFMPYGDGYLLDFYDAYAIIDKNGNISDVQNLNERYTFGSDNKGRYIVSTTNGYGYIEDTSQLTIPELTEFGKYLFGKGGATPGSGGFTAYFPMNDGVFGLTESGELVQVLDYVDSKINVSDICGIAPAGDGKFLMLGIDTNIGGYYISVLNVRPDDYVENRQKVILAVEYSADDNVRDYVTGFTKQSDDYDIEIREYANCTEDLKADILSGNAPDVYQYTKSGDMYNLTNMGALIDMYELSEKYGGFEKDDILDNIIEGFEYKGGLYGISDRFYLPVNIANREVLDREYTDWSFDEFYSFAENLPEDMYLGNHLVFQNPEQVFDYLCTDNLNAWIDFDNATCNLDSSEFIKALEFSRDAKILPERNWEEYDKLPQDEQETLMFEDLFMAKNKTALFVNLGVLGDFSIFSNLKQQIGLSFDEITLVNTPSDNGQYTFNIWGGSLYSVIAGGNCTEGGWAYVNYIMSYDYQISNSMTWGTFVTRKDAFEKIMKYSQELSYNSVVTDESGVTYYYGYDEPITDEQLDYLRSYISKCTVLAGGTEKITEIMNEEYNSFINGEITSQECAQMIQNRVSIYLSENA